MAYGILVPRPEIEPVLPAVGAWAWSLNYCTAVKCQHPFFKAHFNTWSQWMTMTALRGSWSKEGVPLTAELGGDLSTPSRDLFPHCPLPVQPPVPGRTCSWDQVLSEPSLTQMSSLSSVPVAPCLLSTQRFAATFRSCGEKEGWGWCCFFIVPLAPGNPGGDSAGFIYFFLI